MKGLARLHKFLFDCQKYDFHFSTSELQNIITFCKSIFFNNISITSCMFTLNICESSHLSYNYQHNLHNLSRWKFNEWRGQTYLLEGNYIEDGLKNWFNAMEVHKVLPLMVARGVWLDQDQVIFGNKEASDLKVAIYNLAILDSCKLPRQVRFSF